MQAAGARDEPLVPGKFRSGAMRWEDLPESQNVEDRRGEGGDYGGGGFGIPMGSGGIGIGTLVVLALVGYALGIDPRLLIGGAEILTGGGHSYHSPHRAPTHTGPPSDATGKFVVKVLGSTEQVWSDIFQQEGRRYEPPRLVMFSGSTLSACGQAQRAMGPFYCPRDRRVYLDTSFFLDLQRRFHGCDNSKACEFAEAYVIAHEVGHHVQNLLGILPRVQQRQQELGRGRESNHLQVQVELQADCFAGVWANRSAQRWKNLIEPGDIDQALQTASAIGDDRLQRQSRGYVVPDAFTHGSSEDRKHWLTTGLKGGTVEACNTFRGAQT
jgi:predicted metalloprotease